ncbi:cyclic nucleotide-binding domain-containing protein [uncultured Thiodictyon sp.]|jgi:CRP-like cAMP-binding protein|uniref:cyclic nucleotide-binding domain-containing protein n=1 Tax=uncultured Thiodictyon sp. TaxID=1846217 RepID=UPI0025F77F19|nr:cyclic nucleotide-binding domain-containing protein [uncultured Thiodictyon sp.]
MFLSFLQSLLRSSRLGEGVAWNRLSIAAGESLVVEGEVGRSLFVVEGGRFAVLGRAQLQDQSTVEVCLAELTAEDVFGESSLIGDYASIATVRALAAARVIEINGAMLMVYLDDHPEQGYLFFKYLLAVELERLARSHARTIRSASLP